MSTVNLQVSLGLTGLESPLSEMESTLQANVRRFAETVMRPIGERLDRLSAEQVVAPESELWQVFAQAASLGLTAESLFSLEPQERGRLLPLLFEEFGWGDAGLACLMGVAMAPSMVLNHLGRHDLLERYPEGSRIGCWGITEPDHGSDMVDFGGACAAPGGRYGRPNCVVKPDGDELVVHGQKAAWVSAGPIAQLCVLCTAYDDGSGEMKRCVVLVPLDIKGVSRGKPLDKLGQRTLPQGEIFFDEVRIPRDHLLAAPDEYEFVTNAVLCDGNALMGSIWLGCARAAYEHALGYAHQRRQGGVAIIEHQSVRQRLFHMFRKLEAARALNHRAVLFNASAPAPALQGSIATKITSTQTAFELASDAIQIFGGNGITSEYPVEKLFRDARPALIADGCNEMLAIKGGALLIDNDKLAS
ncbi:acyl-CoA dehydrogenase family protein [Pseudomonas putida]|uniref:acyl-CoA dehydrogenase family protein n=1 Tax=Pseudomonas putida TaxID=303 RepID=UPI0023664966|nr:acyl-CoA dehydrogenase family protein [Pseudomonas putida]MDD2050598.1 acyl-CoA dehydrogenase family protein [Pseudomonas putida]